MSQVNLYLDEPTLRRIRDAAKGEGISLSRWVRKRLAMELHPMWPKGYFTLFGALAKESFERPRQGRFSDDVRRAGV
jgi:hypothetical protein